MKKATAFITYFKVRPFSGYIKDYIRRILHDYEHCARQFELSEVEMLRFFSNTIETPSRDFFFINIKDVMRFSGIFSLMEAEYDSSALQSTLQAELEHFHLQTFMSEN